MKSVTVTRSTAEATECNIVVLQMLRAIQMFATLSQTSRLAKTCYLRFTFRKGRGDKNFTGTTTLQEVESGRAGQTQITPDPLLSFTIPDGESMEDAFGWLVSEVVMMAYAMTNGSVGQFHDPFPRFYRSSVDDYGPSYTFWIDLHVLVPDISLAQTPKVGSVKVDTYMASWVHGK